MFVKASTPGADDLAQWRRMATEIAKAGLPLHVHANLTATIGAFLDQIEADRTGSTRLRRCAGRSRT